MDETFFGSIETNKEMRWWRVAKFGWILLELGEISSYLARIWLDLVESNQDLTKFGWDLSGSS